MRTLLFFFVLALLVTSPWVAADSRPAPAKTTTAAMSAQFGSSDAPECSASRVTPGEGAPLPFPVSAALPGDDAPPAGDGPGPICPQGCPQFAACCPYNWCIC